jgi:hypothetical protein
VWLLSDEVGLEANPTAPGFAHEETARYRAEAVTPSHPTAEAEIQPVAAREVVEEDIALWRTQQLWQSGADSVTVDERAGANAVQHWPERFEHRYPTAKTSGTRS